MTLSATRLVKIDGAFHSQTIARMVERRVSAGPLNRPSALTIIVL